MTPSCVSHARRAVPMCDPPSADHRAHPVGPCHAVDIRHSEEATQKPVAAVAKSPAARIAVRDSLCANSMALGGRAVDDSCQSGEGLKSLFCVDSRCFLLSRPAHIEANSPHSCSVSNTVYLD